MVISRRIRYLGFSSKLRQLSLLPLVLLASAAIASAQRVFPAPLKLESAVEKALEKNPQAKLSGSKIDLAAIKVKEARTGMAPIVQFTQSVTRSNDPVFVFSSLLEQGRFKASNFALDSLNDPKGMVNLRSATEFRMPLFDQRQTSARVDQAEIGKQTAELEAEAVRQRLRYGVIRDFFGTILAREMLNVTAQAVKAADANSKRSKDMSDIGMTTDADYLAALVERANVGQRKVEAESALVTSLAELNLAIGEKVDLEHDLIGNLQERYFPVADQDALIRAAFQNRPDYLAAALAIQSSRRESKAIKDTRLPRVDVFGSVSYNSPYMANGSSDYMVGVSLSYSIFDAGRKYRIEEATEAETSAASEKQVLADQITSEVVRALQNYKTAKAKIEVSIKSIAQAEEALEIVQYRYGSGLSTFDRVVGSEAALVKAKHDLLTARYEYLLGYASVLLATGQLRDVRMFD